MSATDHAFAQWLSDAQIAEERLTTEQRGLLQHAFAFRQRCGDDYYSTRLLSHFLLHCESGLKVAQMARLAGISRSTASHQQGVSSKEAIQAAHHRMAGRPHGKLLARYAGPIAEFILTHPDATRYDLLDFIEGAWDVRVSTVALHHFCKKFGLDRASRAAAISARPKAAEPAAPREEQHQTRAKAAASQPSTDRAPAEPHSAETARLSSPAEPRSATPRSAETARPSSSAEPRSAETARPSSPVPLPPPPFSRRARNSREPSC